MKRKNIIIASLLMSGILTSEAQVVKVNNTEALANGEMEIVVTANANINNYVAAGFNLEFPEGFSVVGVEGVKGDAVQSNHVVRVGQTGSSGMRVAIYSLGNATFEVSGGVAPTLCTLKLKAPDKEGSFTGQVTSVEFSTAGHVLTKESGSQFGVILKPGRKKGDVNRDGYVTNSDVQTVVGYIMAGEYDENADLNNDNNVDAADLVLLIKMIQP